MFQPSNEIHFPKIRKKLRGRKPVSHVLTRLTIVMISSVGISYQQKSRGDVMCSPRDQGYYQRWHRSCYYFDPHSAFSNVAYQTNRLRHLFIPWVDTRFSHETAAHKAVTFHIEKKIFFHSDWCKCHGWKSELVLNYVQAPRDPRSRNRCWSCAWMWARVCLLASVAAAYSDLSETFVCCSIGFIVHTTQ